TGLLWLTAFAGSGFTGFPTPKLGLDLQGGMTMTLKASLPGGQTPDSDSMNQARQIIENRVNGTGVAEPEVFVEGADNIVVNVAGKETNREEMRQIGAPAELRFREVLSGPAPDFTAQDPADFEDQPGDDSDAEADDDSSASDDESADGSDDASDEASDEPSDDASPSEDKGEDPAEVDTDIEKQREEVFAKLGDEQVQMATGLVQQQAETGQPLDQQTAGQYMQMLAPFGELTPEEVAVLPPEMQFYIPTIGCGQLDGRTPGAISAAKEQVVGCESPTDEQAADAKENDQPAPYSKYLMADARLVGEDVSNAAVQPDQQAPGKWSVGITFSGEGTDK
ncbi:MAG: hypothetical protein ACRD0P_40005, partial [Stackebrandtia sp.]